MRKICVLALFLPFTICGCSVAGPSATEVETTAPVAGVAFSGMVHGGQQPVSGSTVQLYAAGTGSDGSNAITLGTSTTSLSNGSFSLSGTGWSCTTGQQLYVAVSGGNPGVASANPNLSMMAAIGACGTLTTSSYLWVDEQTTVAAVFALSPYMKSYTAVGSASSDATAMASAFTLATELVNTATGSAPGASVPNGYSSPVTEIYTLADVLATCVNSIGGTAGQSNPCGNLFTDATPYGGTAPTDVVGAALLIAKNPNQNVTSIFGLATATGPYQPIATAAPADWTVPLLPVGVIRILFVGDSFTHGRYLPVRTYNSANVTDENYDINGPASSNALNRMETSSEPGPYGGIPGIFKELTVEAGLNYDVHIEAISSTSLQNNYTYASQVIANPQWNAVVLQELSTRPLTTTLTGDSTSNPNNFCNSVQTIEQGVHTANANANIYLYETWARADEAEALGSSSYATNLGTLTTAYHNVYLQAAANDGKVTSVAPAGDAWLTAMNDGYVTENPYTSTQNPFLWFLYQSGSNPSTSSSSPDYAHPSVYGAYLSALVLYEQITGQNSTTFGGSEAAAVALGIGTSGATHLQSVAHAQVSGASTTYTGNPCSVT